MPCFRSSTNIKHSGRSRSSSTSSKSSSVIDEVDMDEDQIIVNKIALTRPLDLIQAKQNATLAMQALMARIKINTDQALHIVELEGDLRKCKGDLSSAIRQLKQLKQQLDDLKSVDPSINLFTENFNKIYVTLVVSNEGTFENQSFVREIVIL